MTNREDHGHEHSNSERNEERGHEKARPSRGLLSSSARSSIERVVIRGVVTNDARKVLRRLQQNERRDLNVPDSTLTPHPSPPLLSHPTVVVVGSPPTPTATTRYTGR